MNTSFTPATAVVKVRLFGSSPSGPVATLKRGSLIATYAYFPRGFTSRTHSPILAGVPDGWSFGNTAKLREFDSRLKSVNDDVDDGPRPNGTFPALKKGLESNSVRMQKSFIPIILAEEITVRRTHPKALYADVHVSALVRGEGCVHGRWVDSEGTNMDIPSKMFQAGEEFSVMLNVEPSSGRQDMLLCASIRESTLRGCRKTYKQIVKPVGEFVHPPVKLSMTNLETVSGVFIDALTSKQLRAGAGFGEKKLFVTFEYGEMYSKNGFPYDDSYNWNSTDANDVYAAVRTEIKKIFDFYEAPTVINLFDTSVIPSNQTQRQAFVNDAETYLNTFLQGMTNDFTSLDRTEFVTFSGGQASFVQDLIQDGHGLLPVDSA